MITKQQMAELHSAVTGNADDNHAEILDLLHEIHCTLTDVEQICEACEEVVDAAVRARDDAHADILTVQQDAIDAAAGAWAEPAQGGGSDMIPHWMICGMCSPTGFFILVLLFAFIWWAYR